MSEKLLDRMTLVMNASCDCGTESRELDAHAGQCTYRILTEAQTEIKRLRGALEGACNWFEVTLCLIEDNSVEPDDEISFEETLMCAQLQLSAAQKVLNDPS